MSIINIGLLPGLKAHQAALAVTGQQRHQCQYRKGTRVNAWKWQKAVLNTGAGISAPVFPLRISNG